MNWERLRAVWVAVFGVLLYVEFDEIHDSVLATAMGNKIDKRRRKVWVINKIEIRKKLKCALKLTSFNQISLYLLSLLARVSL